MSARVALALTAAALLVASAAAALPASFANPGGPPFLDGANFRRNNETDAVEVLGLFNNGTYSLAYLEDGKVTTEVGVYLSWECVPGQPGYYRALVNATMLDAVEQAYSTELACEYGTIDTTDFLNKWGWSTEECPTTTDRQSSFLAFDGSRTAVTNTCGEAAPAPDAADSAAELEADLQDLRQP